MKQLSAPVGVHATNLKKDVRTVQVLLNSHRYEMPNFRFLRVDGICGPKTVGAIREFQRVFLRMSHPDGRVDLNGPTLPKLSEKPPSRIHHYQIRTLAGGGASWFVGGSATTFEIEELDTKQSALYTLGGVDFGFSFKSPAGGQGPSSWTAFTSDKDLHDFHGYVTLTSVGAAAIGGGGVFRMSFVSGPSAGLTIQGAGWITGLGAAITGTHGWMKLRE
jgi:peptidoglycan hydrolase-like protein with peptidoglycan-binding domain